MDPIEQLAFFYELFDNTLPRLGPGDNASTHQALKALLKVRTSSAPTSKAEKLQVLDIGCGTGAQTLELARHVNGTILAVDNHQPFLDELHHHAAAAGLSQKIKPYLGDMGNLGIKKNTFDLIWSEGAIYIMGFREGLTMCHSLLKPGGLMAVSDLTWLEPDPPDTCRNFFNIEYPAMVDIEANRGMIENSGYTIIGDFTLPDSAWWESYYQPLEYRVNSFQEKYAADPQRLAMIDSVQLEISIFREYSSYYGYVFYLMQRREV